MVDHFAFVLRAHAGQVLLLGLGNTQAVECVPYFGGNVFPRESFGPRPDVIEDIVEVYVVELAAPLGHRLNNINFDDIFYFVRASDRNNSTWDDVPDEVRNTFDRLGIPEAEKKYLGGVGAQYESEVVYHSLREDLQKQGVIFTDMDTALRDYPDLVRQYFSTIIPAGDNKFAALNSAVWSGGSFVYVPENVHVEVPLQAYFHQCQELGQFERTLIIAAPGSYVHYIEGCTAPTYSTDSLHSAVVEIVYKRARGFVIPLSRTGRTTSTTLLPSAPPPIATPPWNGWTATWAVD